MKKILFVALFAVTTTTSFATNYNVGEPVIASVNAVNDEVDDMIASYSKYVDKYIATMKKVKEGDVTAMGSYAKLLKQAQDLQAKIDKVKDDMTEAQLAKFQKVMLKLAKAAEDL